MTDSENAKQSALGQAAERLMARWLDWNTKKQAEREISQHAARPGLTELPSELDSTFWSKWEDHVSDFWERWELLKQLPPGTPQEYQDAFNPIIEKNVSIPPPEQQNVIEFTLWTQHLVHFGFAYGEECIDALLWKSVHSRLSISPEQFNRKTSDSDDIERARKVRELVERHEADVTLCVSRAKEMFLDALRGRLGSVVIEACNECAIRAIDELLPKLHNDCEVSPSTLRESELKWWAGVEKARFDTRLGPRTFKSAEDVEALIDEACEKLKPAGLENNKTAVLQYINRHYPTIRCSSVKQLNRLLKKFGLTGKFPPDEGETRRKRRRQG